MFITTAFGFTDLILEANTSLSACDTISHLVTTTISANLSIGHTFFGVFIHDRLSITHIALISFIYGLHLLHNPALSLINISTSCCFHHSNISSTLLTKK
jgi:hypothetical protein